MNHIPPLSNSPWIVGLDGLKKSPEWGELLESLRITLREALEFNRHEAIEAVGDSFEEVSVAVWNGKNYSDTFAITVVAFWDRCQTKS